MEIAFPITQDLGFDSRVHDHFGTADYFLVVETEKDAVETRVNQDKGHESGQCRPLDALGDRRVDAVAVGGIGGGALRKLRSGGVKTYRAVEGTVRENLDLIRAGKLPEFAPEHTCSGNCDH